MERRAAARISDALPRESEHMKAEEQAIESQGLCKFIQKPFISFRMVGKAQGQFRRVKYPIKVPKDFDSPDFSVLTDSTNYYEQISSTLLTLAAIQMPLSLQVTMWH